MLNIVGQFAVGYNLDTFKTLASFESVLSLLLLGFQPIFEHK